MFIRLRQSVLLKMARVLQKWTDLLVRRIERIEREQAAFSVRPKTAEAELFRASGGPPAHWLELVKRHAPALLQPADRIAVEETTTVFTSRIDTNHGSRVSLPTTRALQKLEQTDAPAGSPDTIQAWRQESRLTAVQPEGVDRTGTKRAHSRPPSIERHSALSATPPAPVTSQEQKKALPSATDATAGSTQSKKRTPFLPEQAAPAKAAQYAEPQTRDSASERVSKGSVRVALTSQTENRPQTARSHRQDQDWRKTPETDKENRQPLNCTIQTSRSLFRIESNSFSRRDQAQQNRDPQPTGSVREIRSAHQRITNPTEQSLINGAVQPRKAPEDHAEPVARQPILSEPTESELFTTNQALWPDLPDEENAEARTEAADRWPSLPEDAWTQSGPSAETPQTVPALFREAQRRGRVDREQQGKLWNG